MLPEIEITAYTFQNMYVLIWQVAKIHDQFNFLVSKTSIFHV